MDKGDCSEEQKSSSGGRSGGGGGAKSAAAKEEQPAACLHLTEELENKIRAALPKITTWPWHDPNNVSLDLDLTMKYMGKELQMSTYKEVIGYVINDSGQLYCQNKFKGSALWAKRSLEDVEAKINEVEAVGDRLRQPVNRLEASMDPQHRRRNRETEQPGQPRTPTPPPRSVRKGGRVVVPSRAQATAAPEAPLLLKVKTEPDTETRSAVSSGQGSSSETALPITDSPEQHTGPGSSSETALRVTDSPDQVAHDQPIDLATPSPALAPAPAPPATPTAVRQRDEPGSTNSLYDASLASGAELERSPGSLSNMDLLLAAIGQDEGLVSERGGGRQSQQGTLPVVVEQRVSGSGPDPVLHGGPSSAPINRDKGLGNESGDGGQSQHRPFPSLELVPNLYAGPGPYASRPAPPTGGGPTSDPTSDLDFDWMVRSTGGDQGSRLGGTEMASKSGGQESRQESTGPVVPATGGDEEPDYDTEMAKSLRGREEAGKVFLEAMEKHKEDLFIEVKGPVAKFSTWEDCPLKAIKGDQRQLGLPKGMVALFFRELHAGQALMGRIDDSSQRLSAYLGGSGLVPGDIFKVCLQRSNTTKYYGYLGNFVFGDPIGLARQEGQLPSFKPSVWLVVVEVAQDGKLLGSGTKHQQVFVINLGSLDSKLEDVRMEKDTLGVLHQKLEEAVVAHEGKRERTRRASTLVKQAAASLTEWEKELRSALFWNMESSLSPEFLTRLWNLFVRAVFAHAGIAEEVKGLVMTTGPTGGSMTHQLQPNAYIKIIIQFCAAKGFKSIYQLATGGMRVLDWGCGIGVLGFFMAFLGCHVTLLDRDFVMYGKLIDLKKALLNMTKMGTTDKVVQMDKLHFTLPWKVETPTLKHCDPADTYESLNGKFDMIAALTAAEVLAHRAALMPIVYSKGLPLQARCTFVAVELKELGQRDEFVKWGILTNADDAKVTYEQFSKSRASKPVLTWVVQSKQKADFTETLKQATDLPKDTPHLESGYKSSSGKSECEGGGGQARSLRKRASKPRGEEDDEEDDEDEDDEDEDEDEEESSGHKKGGVKHPKKPKQTNDQAPPPSPHSFSPTTRAATDAIMIAAKHNPAFPESPNRFRAGKKKFFTRLRSMSADLKKRGKRKELHLEFDDMVKLASLSDKSLTQWNTPENLDLKSKKTVNCIKATAWALTQAHGAKDLPALYYDPGFLLHARQPSASSHYQDEHGYGGGVGEMGDDGGYSGPGSSPESESPFKTPHYQTRDKPPGDRRLPDPSPKITSKRRQEELEALKAVWMVMTLADLKSDKTWEDEDGYHAYVAEREAEERALSKDKEFEKRLGVFSEKWGIQEFNNYLALHAEKMPRSHLEILTKTVRARFGPGGSTAMGGAAASHGSTGPGGPEGGAKVTPPPPHSQKHIRGEGAPQDFEEEVSPEKRARQETDAQREEEERPSRVDAADSIAAFNELVKETERKKEEDRRKQQERQRAEEDERQRQEEERRQRYEAEKQRCWNHIKEKETEELEEYLTGLAAMPKPHPILKEVLEYELKWRRDEQEKKRRLEQEEKRRLEQEEKRRQEREEEAARARGAAALSRPAGVGEDPVALLESLRREEPGAGPRRGDQSTTDPRDTKARTTAPTEEDPIAAAERALDERRMQVMAQVADMDTPRVIAIRDRMQDEYIRGILNDVITNRRPPGEPGTSSGLVMPMCPPAPSLSWAPGGEMVTYGGSKDPGTYMSSPDRRGRDRSSYPPGGPSSRLDPYIPPRHGEARSGSDPVLPHYDPSWRRTETEEFMARRESSYSRHSDPQSYARREGPPRSPRSRSPRPRSRSPPRSPARTYERRSPPRQRYDPRAYGRDKSSSDDKEWRRRFYDH